MCAEKSVEDILMNEIYDEDDEEFYKLLEMLSSSSSSSESSDEEDGDFPNELFGPPIHRNIIRMKRYFEDCVDQFDDQQFKENFRISRNTFNILLNKLILWNKLPSHTFGRVKISPKNAFLMTIWYLANSETFRQISDRFDVTRRAAYFSINRVVLFFVEISPEYVKWPSYEESFEIAENFKSKQNISFVIGAIDGSHINIKKPSKNVQHAYCNRKSMHSIVLQAVCDDKKRFIDVFCGEPGSVHDARVLRKSNIYSRYNENKLQNFVILGDSAYPNLEWLIPPFKDNGNLTELQKTFNYKHSSTRIVIENAFGLLKGRFRRLRNFENVKIEFIVKSVIAACVIHNVCINLDDLEIPYEINVNNEAEEEYLLEDVFETGRDRRLELLNELFALV